MLNLRNIGHHLKAVVVKGVKEGVTKLKKLKKLKEVKKVKEVKAVKKLKEVKEEVK